MNKSATPQTLDGVIARLGDLTDLGLTRRRDLVSSVRRMAHILGRTPAETPARLNDLKPALTKIHPEQMDPPISKKTWTNLRSNFLMALRVTGASQGGGRSLLEAPWAELYEALPEKRVKDGLSRFIHFLSAKGIPGDDVDDAVVQHFMEWVAQNTLLDPRQQRDLHRRTTRLWNEAGESSAGWPKQTLSIPDHRGPRTTLAFEELSPKLQKEINRHLEWLAGGDPMADHQPPRPCKPETIRHRRDTLLFAASAWVNRGHSVAELTSLREMVEPDRVKEMLRQYYAKEDNASETTDGGANTLGEPRVMAHMIAQALFSVARHWLQVDEKLLQSLRDIKAKLGPQRTGLTAKNRAALRQFEDDRNKHLLLSLPGKLFEEALAEDRGDERSAVKAQMALAIEILLMAPVRARNLIRLRFGESLIRPGGKRGPWHIVLNEEDTKTGDPIEYVLPDHLTEMIDVYAKRFRKWLGPSGGSGDAGYLFPGRKGGHKGQTTLTGQIKSIIFKRTGLTLTAHQFRHLAAKFLLDAEPGNYAAAGQLLGHRNAKTTISMYTGMRTRAAGRHHDRLLGLERERLKEAHEPRRGAGGSSEPEKRRPVRRKRLRRSKI